MRAPTVQYLRGINGVLDVASARVLGFLALTGSFWLFGFAIYDPDRIRLAVASVYAVTVMWPILLLYWKVDKGDDQ